MGKAQRGESRRSLPARHKVLSGLLVLVCLLVVAVVGWGYYLNHQIADVPRVALHLPEADRPPPAQAEPAPGLGEGDSEADTPDDADTLGDAETPDDADTSADADAAADDQPRPLNILLAGLDNGRAPSIADAVASGDWQPGVYRSDVIMVLHLTANRDHAYLISIPRDSWIEVPGYGMNKINAAFSYGGPSLYVRTVEQFTGLRMDHLAIIGWHAFEDLATALGGVRVYIPQTVTDPIGDRTWEQGYHTLEGQAALKYVRQRHGLPRGDFSRIERQQNFLRATMEKVQSRGTLANPLKLTNVLEAVTDHLVLDAGFSTSEVRSLALSLRGMTTKDVTFLTVPVKGTGRVDGASVVFVDRERTRALFDAVRAYQLPSYLDTHDADRLSGPRSVR